MCTQDLVLSLLPQYETVRCVKDKPFETKLVASLRLASQFKKKKKCTVKGGRIELEKIQAEKIKITPPQFLLLCA